MNLVPIVSRSVSSAGVSCAAPAQSRYRASQVTSTRRTFAPRCSTRLGFGAQRPCRNRPRRAGDPGGSARRNRRHGGAAPAPRARATRRASLAPAECPISPRRRRATHRASSCRRCGKSSRRKFSAASRRTVARANRSGAARRRAFRGHRARRRSFRRRSSRAWCRGPCWRFPSLELCQNRCGNPHQHRGPRPSHGVRQLQDPARRLGQVLGRCLGLFRCCHICSRCCPTCCAHLGAVWNGRRCRYNLRPRCRVRHPCPAFRRDP